MATPTSLIGTSLRGRTIRADVLTSAEALDDCGPGDTIVLDAAVPAQIPAPTPTITSLRFVVVRPADLLVLDCIAKGMSRESGEGGAALVAREKGGSLSVRLPYQHVGEGAALEGAGGAPAGGNTETPVAARAARRSRLVFDVPAGTRIDYSVEGVLDAMMRLALRVVPLATPRSLALVQLADVTPILTVGGMTLHDVDGQLFISEHDVVPAGTGVSPIGPGSGTMISIALSLRTLTKQLSASAPVLVTAQKTATGTSRMLSGSALAQGLVLGSIKRPPTRTPVPRAPTETETAIEAPFRLSMSPSSYGGWTHARASQHAPGDQGRVELWHTRLGVRLVDAKTGAVSVDERDNPQRILRAVWTRELELPAAQRGDARVEPFTGSLDAGDRQTLVGESTQPVGGKPARPVDAKRLMLSALGAWTSYDSSWPRNTGTTLRLPKDISAWRHIAAQGRDQYVRVDYPGFLYPFGHEATLVKVTERRIDTVTNPQARLHQHFYIVVSEPVKRYTNADLPFTEVRVEPLTTPWIDPVSTIGTDAVDGERLFWPHVSGKVMQWKLRALDRNGDPLTLEAPLLFVGTAFKGQPAAVQAAYQMAGRDTVPGGSQAVAFAPSSVPGDTQQQAQTITFLGEMPGGVPLPRMRRASVVVPAMQRLAPAAPAVNVVFSPTYLAHGFGGAANAGELFLELETATKVAFGSTEKSGGFIKPDVPVAALSRSIGLAGDVANVASGTFDPNTFFAGALPKLFGLISLVDIIEDALGLPGMPRFVTEALDQVSALLADIERLHDAIAALPEIEADVRAAIDAFKAKLQALLSAGSASAEEVATAFPPLVDALSTQIGSVRLKAAEQAGVLDPTARATLERLVTSISAALAEAAQLVTAIAAFLNGLDPGNLSARAHLEWHPKLKQWPAGNADAAIFLPPPSGTLDLSVDVQVSGSGGAGVDILAKLDNFTIQLLPGAPLIKLHFDRLAFRSGTGRKSEIDVVFGGIEFVGLLGFIEVLRDLIPLDGFSDPPFVDVSAQGVSAGFTMALPNVAVGIFSLTNISLGADARIPFLGDSPLDIGFNFCTRDRPFTLAVFPLGGGGFVGLRASPHGMELLEMSLEFGATVSIDLVVASGSVSAMGGVYLRLEGAAGSLTGYFRIRGEVDVLSLISASIELYMALSYEFSSGKMVGQASITVKVEVLFFSKSVAISCEKRFAGSNGDPTVREMLGVDPGGGSLAWDAYCSAFGEA